MDKSIRVTPNCFMYEETSGNGFPYADKPPLRLVLSSTDYNVAENANWRLGGDLIPSCGSRRDPGYSSERSSYGCT